MAKKKRLARIERAVLSDQVFRVITDGLLNGHFKPGDYLVENELADMLGVSRSPIREALVELQKSGLVTKDPGRRATIRDWSARDIEELFAVRALLEGYAATLVADKNKSMDFDHLEDIILYMRDAADIEDYARLVQLDIEFHEHLWKLAGNILLETVLNGIKQQFRLFLTLNWKFHGGAGQVPQNHQYVVDALRSGNPAKAGQILRSHVVVERMVAIRRQDAD